MSKWDKGKTELSTEIRQVSHKYESELKKINLLLEEEKERSNDLENQL